MGSKYRLLENNTPEINKSRSTMSKGQSEHSDQGFWEKLSKFVTQPILLKTYPFYLSKPYHADHEAIFSQHFPHLSNNSNSATKTIVGYVFVRDFGNKWHRSYYITTCKNEMSLNPFHFVYSGHSTWVLRQTDQCGQPFFNQNKTLIPEEGFLLSLMTQIRTRFHYFPLKEG